MKSLFGQLTTLGPLPVALCVVDMDEGPGVPTRGMLIDGSLWLCRLGRSTR